MNYYKDFENLELPTYHVKKQKLTKACFEQPFANNRAYPYEETKTMTYINKEKLIEILQDKIKYYSKLGSAGKVEAYVDVLEEIRYIDGIELGIDIVGDEIIDAQDKAFDKFSKTDMYKAILGMSIAKTNEDLATNNSLNKWLDEDIDE